MSEQQGLGRPYVALLVGQVTSRLGDGIYDIGLLWLVISRTGSGLAAGITLMCEELPALIFPMLGGALADRFNRRQLLLLFDLCRVILPLALGLAMMRGYFSLPVIYISTFFLSSLARLQSPAMQALFPSTVDPAHYQQANAVFRIVEQVARITGPLLGGVMVAAAPVSVFFANALSFLIAGFFTLLIPLRIGAVPVAASVQPAPASLWMSAREGLWYVYRRSNIGVLIGLGALAGVALGPLNVAVPTFVMYTLNLDSTAFGWAGATIGLGMLIGAAIAILLPKGAVGIGVIKWSLVAAGFSFLLIGYLGTFPALLTLNLVAGTCIMLGTVTGQTLLQSTVPEEWRGRVFAVMELFISSLSPASIFAAGLLIEHWQPGTMIVLVGGVLAAGALASLLIRNRKVIHDVNAT